MVTFRNSGIGTRSEGGPTEVVPSQAHTFPRPGEVVIPERDPRRRANRYAGPCVNGCGFKVQADEGYLAGGPGAWKAEHIVCPTSAPVEVTPEAPVYEAPVTVTQTVVNGAVLFDGTYTLETLTGHRTFRLRTQGTDEEFMPGKQLVEYLSGADNEGDYTRFAHVVGNQPRVWKKHQDNGALNADLKAFWADPSQALHSTQCYRCHRTLTVPASVHNGLGPECSKMV